MGFLETAVVVYLRELYYPYGFSIPMVGMSRTVIVTELWREVATIVMLAMIGIMVGKKPLQRFGYFIYCFAVWDIFYYVFLKTQLGWPENLLTWDILFLIPVPWVGPVLAPILVSLTMILWTAIIEEHEKNITRKTWLFFITGSVIVICSFMWDYLLSAITGNDLIKFSTTFQPVTYNWWVFLVGEVLMLYGILSPLIIPGVEREMNHQTKSDQNISSSIYQITKSSN